MDSFPLNLHEQGTESICSVTNVKIWLMKIEIIKICFKNYAWLKQIVDWIEDLSFFFFFFF